ncbi:MAG: glycosyltransferase family 2 protein [Chloroflexi bacterium]|nr:glycosyltransferase family 2 protein [Chloroflexota bacterium]
MRLDETAPLTTSSRGGPQVSVVIPARNEAENIGLVLRALPEIVDEVIVVDGHSSDETCDVVRARRPDAVVLSQTGRGKGDALRTGFAAARGEFVVMLDADGSMNPAEIRRIVRLLEDGFEFVKGSRFMTGGGTSDITGARRVGATALLRLANVLYGTHHTDLLYGYCGFRRDSLQRLCLSADGFEIETEIVVRAARYGLMTAEVPSFEAERLAGKSHLHAVRDGFRVLRTLLRERFAPPLADRDEAGLAPVLIALPEVVPSDAKSEAAGIRAR